MNTIKKLESKLQAAIDERAEISYLASAKERLDINLAYIDKLSEISLEATTEMVLTIDQEERSELNLVHARCAGRIKGALDTCRIINDVWLK